MMALPQDQLPQSAQPPQPPPSSMPPQPSAAQHSSVELVTSSQEPIDALEKKFWALMRIVARKGLITKEEFMAELKND